VAAVTAASARGVAAAMAGGYMQLNGGGNASAGIA